MAYSVTCTFTRPDEDTAMPTMAAINSSAQTVTHNALPGAGITKTYEVDGLVTRVIYTAEDKATYTAGRTTIENTSGSTMQGTVPADYKQACIDAGITCVITDSDGVTINSW